MGGGNCAFCNIFQFSVWGSLLVEPMVGDVRLFCTLRSVVWDARLRARAFCSGAWMCTC